MEKMGDVIMKLDSHVEYYGNEFMSYVRKFGHPLTDKDRKRLEELQQQLRNTSDSDDYDDDDD